MLQKLIQLSKSLLLMTVWQTNIPKQSMKRILAVFAVTVTLLTTSCGNNAEQTVSEIAADSAIAPADATAEETTTDTTIAIESDSVIVEDSISAN